MNSIIVVVIVLFVWPFHVLCVSNVEKKHYKQQKSKDTFFCSFGF